MCPFVMGWFNVTQLKPAMSCTGDLEILSASRQPGGCFYHTSMFVLKCLEIMTDSNRKGHWILCYRSVWLGTCPCILDSLLFVTKELTECQCSWHLTSSTAVIKRNENYEYWNKVVYEKCGDGGRAFNENDHKFVCTWHECNSCCFSVIWVGTCY